MIHHYYFQSFPHIFWSLTSFYYTYLFSLEQLFSNYDFGDRPWKPV